MSRRSADRPGVALVEVDEIVLDELVRVATTDAAVNDVTPPLTEGNSWTDVRVDWLRAFHRDRRGSLDGPQQESTWAVLGADGAVLGAVRLKRTADLGVLETGIWLARGARGRGLGTAAAAAVVERAAALGATALRADTTSNNGPALAVLARVGFHLRPADDSAAVHALLTTRPPTEG